jgi:hypothetical protein
VEVLGEHSAAWIAPDMDPEHVPLALEAIMLAKALVVDGLRHRLLRSMDRNASVIEASKSRMRLVASVISG